MGVTRFGQWKGCGVQYESQIKGHGCSSEDGPSGRIPISRRDLTIGRVCVRIYFSREKS